jgi:hypothetical protein
MRTLRLMADYWAWPVWEPGSEEYNIDPETLDISAGLRSELAAWAREYDGTIDQSYPPNSGFVDVQTAARWLEDGRRLALRLEQELGPRDWRVVYWHDREQAADLVATVG